LLAVGLLLRVRLLRPRLGLWRRQHTRRLALAVPVGRAHMYSRLL
jgi:hypothetical protein